MALLLYPSYCLQNTAINAIINHRLTTHSYLVEDLMKTLKQIVQKHKELILYGFFGGLTTLCNFVVYYISAHVLSIDELSATVIAFIVSVLFAFFTNRQYVFQIGRASCRERV